MEEKYSGWGLGDENGPAEVGERGALKDAIGRVEGAREEGRKGEKKAEWELGLVIVDARGTAGRMSRRRGRKRAEEYSHPQLV